MSYQPAGLSPSFLLFELLGALFFFIVSVSIMIGWHSNMINMYGVMQERVKALNYVYVVQRQLPVTGNIKYNCTSTLVHLTMPFSDQQIVEKTLGQSLPETLSYEKLVVSWISVTGKKECLEV